MDNFRKQVPFAGTSTSQVKDNPVLKALFECLKDYNEKTESDKKYPNIFVGVQTNEDYVSGIIHLMVAPKQ